MRKAIIKDNIVINIIEVGNNGVQGIQLPIDQILWDCTQYAVGIGDTFIDGKFYRENEPVERILTTEEKLFALQQENEQLQSITASLLVENLESKGVVK